MNDIVSNPYDNNILDIDENLDNRNVIVSVNKVIKNG